MSNSKLKDQLLAIALLALAVAGCKQFKSLTRPTVLKSKDGKFQITVPAGWQENALSSTKANIKAASPLEEMYVVVMSEQKVDFVDDLSLDQYTAMTLETMTSTLSEPVSSPPLTININGNTGRQYEIQGAARNVKLAYLVTTVETAEHFHKIATWTLRSRIDRNQITLQKVAESFRVIAQGGTDNAAPSK